MRICARTALRQSGLLVPDPGRDLLALVRRPRSARRRPLRLSSRHVCPAGAAPVRWGPAHPALASSPRGTLAERPERLTVRRSALA